MSDMADYSVHDEPEFVRVYDEDDMVTIRRGDLRALLDLSTMSMDFGSGFLDEEQVEVLHAAAAVLGVDKITVTPSNFVCKYSGKHQMRWVPAGFVRKVGCWRCTLCAHEDTETPEPDDARAERMAQTMDVQWFDVMRNPLGTVTATVATTGDAWVFPLLPTMRAGELYEFVMGRPTMFAMPPRGSLRVVEGMTAVMVPMW